MAIDQDVVVIGGGLAGIMAAITAANAGATTRLISAKQSTLRQASGMIDVLGYMPTKEMPVVDPFGDDMGIESLPDKHPYSLAGRPALESGLAIFDAITGTSYAGDHTPANALLPTKAGTIKPTARYPASMAAGLASDDRDALLVGFERLPAFDGELAAAHLRECGVPFDVRGLTVEFPVPVEPDAKSTRYATLLDENVAEESDSIRRDLAERIAAERRGERRIGLPAILGLESHTAVRDELERILATDVFEVAMGPPSLPGRRLEAMLFGALEDAGVLIETGNPAISYEGTDGKEDSERIESVLVDRNGAAIPYTASEFVLATGDFVGQGMAADRERVSEPIFDCHVSAPEDRYEWFEDDAFGDHQFARFGLTVDDQLHPQSANERPEFHNLRAAGAVLGNYNYVAELSASGVSIATGYRAGTLAAEAA